MAKVFLVLHVERSSSPQVKLIIGHMKEALMTSGHFWAQKHGQHFARHYEGRK